MVNILKGVAALSGATHETLHARSPTGKPATRHLHHVPPMASAAVSRSSAAVPSWPSQGFTSRCASLGGAPDGAHPDRRLPATISWSRVRGPTGSYPCSTLIAVIAQVCLVAANSRHLHPIRNVRRLPQLIDRIGPARDSVAPFLLDGPPGMVSAHLCGGSSAGLADGPARATGPSRWFGRRWPSSLLLCSSQRDAAR